MTVTIRERNVLALLDLIQHVSGIPDLVVERNRDAEVTHFPTVNLIDGDHEPVDINNVFEMYDMDVQIELYVSADTAAKNYVTFDQAYGLVSKAVFSDDSLGGNCILLTPTGLRNVQTLRNSKGTQPARAGALGLTARFVHAYGDPFTPSPA